MKCSFENLGSAITVERVFIGGQDLIGLRQARLQAATIKMLMVLKARLRMLRKAVIDLVNND